MPLTKKAERTKAKLTASARKLISERYRKIYTILKHTKEEDRLKEDTPVAFLTKLLLSHLYGALITWCMLGGSFKLSEESNQFVTEEVNAFLYKYMK